MNLTDKEIEKAAKMQFCDLDYPTLEKNKMEGLWSAGAKFARDHSPKFKTLEDWGWKVVEPIPQWETAIVCDFEFSIYHVIKNENGFFWFGAYRTNANQCDSFDHGKQLAQSDYENKLKALLK